MYTVYMYTAVYNTALYTIKSQYTIAYNNTLFMVLCVQLGGGGGLTSVILQTSTKLFYILSKLNNNLRSLTSGFPRKPLVYSYYISGN